MKKSFLLLFFIFPACTVIHGDKLKGTYTYAALGGDAKQYAQTSEGVAATDINNSESFRKAANIAHSVIWASAVKGIANSLSGAWKSTANAKTAANLEKAKSADAVKIEEIHAKTAETEILNQAPTP